MGSFLRAFLRVSLLAVGLWSVTRWRAVDSIIAFPETAIVLLITGVSVLVASARYALSLWLRCVVTVGLVDLALRSAIPLVARIGDGVAVRAVITVAVVGAISFAIQRLGRESHIQRWDAPVFYVLASLFIAIGTRDAVGGEVWPYTAGNTGIWVLFAFAAIAATRALFDALAVSRSAVRHA